MSLPDASRQEIPAETIRIAQASFPKGNKLMRVRERFGPLFEREDFQDLYSWKGERGVPPEILASVTVLQYIEGLSDREAAEQVRGRIDWKYLLGLEITYAGFDHSALGEFRTRLQENQAATRLFEKPLFRMRESGLVKERGKQRTDSTHVLGVIHSLNRLELVGESLRQALNHLSIEGRGWLTSWVPTDWIERYGSRIEEAKLPTEESERKELVVTIGEDGLTLLSKLYDEKTPDYLKQLPAVEVLRQVWLQQYEMKEDKIGWREAGNTPPADRMINSPYDPEARFSRKRTTTWTGYKVHLTESCEPALPHLLTHIETTPATEPDCHTLPTIQDALAQKKLLPSEHLIDSGYVDTNNVVESQLQHQVELVGPMRPDTSWQARQQTGYDIANFLIDWENQSVTCPQGKTSHVWSPSQSSPTPSISVRFRKQDCLACPVRTLCTQAESDPRGLHLQPSQKAYQTLQQARFDQLQPEFKERYKLRAGIEGSISQGVRSFQLRRTRFIGHAKTKLQHLATATAINFSRLADWFANQNFAQTRSSPFAELAPFLPT